jgi:hypothetical protein
LLGYEAKHKLYSPVSRIQGKPPNYLLLLPGYMGKPKISPVARIQEKPPNYLLLLPEYRGKPKLSYTVSRIFEKILKVSHR